MTSGSNSIADSPAMVPHRPGPATLTAVRIPLPPGASIDPFALCGPSGILMAEAGKVLVGLGVALDLELPLGLTEPRAIDAVLDELAAIRCDDRLGTALHASATRGVIAFGALPFDRRSAASMIVPGLLYCLEPDGSEWVTIVGSVLIGQPDPDDPSAGSAIRDYLVGLVGITPTGDPSPTHVRIDPRSSDNEFRQTVASGVEAIRAGHVEKVVLARAVDVHLVHEIDRAALLRRWAASEPNCSVFSVPTATGHFMGASPELLVARTGDHFRSRPLAGTTDRFPDPTSTLPAALLDSTKDGTEHRLVIEELRDALAPLSIELNVPDSPELVHLNAITHLGTTIDGVLRPDAGGRVPSVLHLAALLHPTPAVGGVPRQVALELIDRLEPTPRGTYAGPVGYVDAAGDGRWMVGIRAMTVSATKARLTAGVGVVAGSSPDTELREASLKLSTIFDALAPGVTFSTASTTD